MSISENSMPLLEEYCGYVKQKKALEAKIKSMDGEVRPLLEDQGSVLVGREYTVELKLSAGRKSLDKAAVEAAGINLEPFYKVGKPFSTLTVKVLG